MKQTIFKIAIVGDGATGKTSLIRAKTEKKFITESSITIGVDIQCIPFELSNEVSNEEQKNTTFLSVDLGGQERFHFIHDSYIRGIKGAVILYDLSRFRSFMNLPKWFNLVCNENPEIPIFLVGTKKDLILDDKIEFFQEEWENMKEKIPNSDHVICHTFISSKTNEGVDELFNICQNVMINAYENEQKLN